MSDTSIKLDDAAEIAAKILEETKKWCDLLEGKILEKASELTSWPTINQFRTAYFLMKDKFSKIFRNSWERYFEHLRSVTEWVLDFKNPSVRKSIIAILHDSIEDTDIDFHTLKILFWPEIAIAVQGLSKEPWEKYLDEDIDVEQVRADEKQRAKQKRNEIYFSHYASFDTMKKHLKSIAQENGLDISEEELNVLTQETIDVKLADRIHNLQTQWNPDDLETVKRKIEETEEYFMEISKETNTDTHKKLQSFIIWLKVKTLWVVKKTNEIL